MSSYRKAERIARERAATEEERGHRLSGVKPRALDGVPEDKRGAHYSCYLCLSDPDGNVRLETHGECHGVIATSSTRSGVDIYLGSGGAPEGVLAAAALRCIGGQMQGRLLFRNDDERGRAAKWGITDLDLVYNLLDLGNFCRSYRSIV